MSTAVTLDAPENEVSAKPSGRRIPLDVVLVVVVGFMAAIYPLLRGEATMTSYGYDGSVYLGASVRLLHGAIPYRDFVFGQPPGIALLMLPVSLVSTVLGTEAALWLVRLATILVVTANCGLVAVLLKRFGVAASLTGGLFLALYSAAYAADSQLKLEPYLVCFCLLSALLLFERTGIAGGRRAMWAGVMIGIAALVKLSGLIPALVMLVLVARKRRDALARFVVGASVTFGIACIGFLAAAPSAFFREVFYYPLLPESSRQPGASWTFLGRGKYLAYTDFRPIADLFPSNRQVIALWIAVVVAVLIVLAVVLRRKVMTSLEWFAVWSLALVTPALLSSPHAFTYYLYFQAPFLALVGGSLAAWGWARLEDRLTGGVQLAAGSIAVAGLVTVSVLAWQAQSSFSQGFAPGFVVTPLGWVNAAVPSGSCVVTDDAYLTLATDRFSASSGGCPEQVDAYGTWGVAYPSDPPPPIASVPKLTYQWAQMMSASDYVLLDSWTNDFVPWTRALDAWFHQNFTLVHSQGGVSLYRNEFVSPL